MIQIRATINWQRTIKKYIYDLAVTLTLDPLYINVFTLSFYSIAHQWKKVLY